MDVESLVNRRVLICPIKELGTVISYHYDDRDEPIIVAVRDSDGERHCCRIGELEVQPTADEVEELIDMSGE